MVTLTKKPEQDAISPFDGQTLDLKEPLKTAWTLIEERVGDRRSTFHLPTVAPTPKDADTNDGLGNFCLVIATVHRLEWLNLEASGHQRAAFDWAKGGTLSARWLAP